MCCGLVGYSEKDVGAGDNRTSAAGKLHRKWQEGRKERKRAEGGEPLESVCLCRARTYLTFLLIQPLSPSVHACTHRWWWCLREGGGRPRYSYRLQLFFEKKSLARGVIGRERPTCRRRRRMAVFLACGT